MAIIRLRLYRQGNNIFFPLNLFGLIVFVRNIFDLCDLTMFRFIYV